MSLVELWRRVAHVLQGCIRSVGRRSNPPTPVLESLPWPPQDILNDRITYMSQIRARPPRAIIGTARDTALHCLYRLYERLVLDDTIGYRNEIEYFWWHRDWPVVDIPDPQDGDGARYAFLAAIPHLLVRAFNSNIRIGLARYTPAIISPEEAEALQNTPEEQKLYESVPQWTLQAKPLKEVLIIPMVSGPDLVLPQEEELNLTFKKMNIRLGAPHVLFT